MKLKLCCVLLIASVSLQANIDLNFSDPDISIVNNHTLNLLNKDKIQDPITGYVFSINDLNLKRINYRTNILDGKQTIEVYALVRCGIEYVDPDEKNSEISNYWFIRIIYDVQGNVINVLPMLTHRDCSNQLTTFEDPKIHENIPVDFIKTMNFQKPELNHVMNYITNLIQSGKIINNKHTFTLNELEITTIGFAVYQPHLEHIIAIDTKIKCDIVYQDDFPGKKLMYNYLFIHINPLSKKVSTGESLGNKLGVECNNKNESN